MYPRVLTESIWESLLSPYFRRAFTTVRIWTLMRDLVLILLGVFLWVLVALRAHPVILGSRSAEETAIFFLRALLAADVLSTILIAVFVFWVAMRVAAIYLDDIFELKDVQVAGRFIRQAAFATSYDLIEIKDGQVIQEHQRSPVFLIGGPGKVRVYLENAALFEKIDGTPHVIGPTVRGSGTIEATQVAGRRTIFSWLRRLIQPGWSRRPRPVAEAGDAFVDGVEVLDGFERLRSIIDLRDQVFAARDIQIFERTRDGIRIEAKDVKFVFSVLRDGKQANLRRPYPFSEGAIMDLVYLQTQQNWTDAMTNLIRREIKNFIAAHDLSEFLAASNAPEIDRWLVEELKIRTEAHRLAGLQDDVSAEPPDQQFFVSRRDLTDRFYDLTSGFIDMAEAQGVQLGWIGVGTWETPDEIIPERHLEAWRISIQNFVRGNDRILEGLIEESYLGELSLMVREVPLTKFQEMITKEEARERIIKELALTYRSRLRAAFDLMERDQESVEAQRTRQVLEHLARVLYHKIGEG